MPISPLKRPRWHKKIPAISSILILMGCLVALSACTPSGGSGQTDTVADSALPTATSVLAHAVSLTNIHMLDAKNGWAITSDNHVLHTTTGVASWQDITPPSRGENDTFGPAYFLNSQDGWIVAQSHSAFDVFYTVNGGGLWYETPLAESATAVSSITFTDTQNGWLLFDQAGSNGTDKVDILHTLDGGADWASIAASDPNASAQSGIAENGRKTGLGFQSFSNGWLTGADATGNDVSFYTSTDGGYTWKSQILSMPAGKNSQTITTFAPTFFDAQNGVLPVSFSPDNNNIAIYHTHDAGKTWNASPIQENISSNSVFADPNDGWSVGGNNASQIYMTANGGSTWTATGKLPAGITNVQSLDLISQTDGWVIGSNAQHQFQLLQTSDGGKTWTSINPDAN